MKDKVKEKLWDRAQNEMPSEPTANYSNPNSQFQLGDLVYVAGQATNMTVVRLYIDPNAGPMVEACWIISNGSMQICALPEEVFRKA